MALNAPYPHLDELLVTIGHAGLRLSHIDASEGAAGNISICIGWRIEVRRRFPLSRRTAACSPRRRASSPPSRGHPRQPTSSSPWSWARTAPARCRSS
ncbi:MAG TPA: hypothetical protein VF832_02385 [Longimicrobiales bacterium]